MSSRFKCLHSFLSFFLLFSFGDILAVELSEDAVTLKTDVTDISQYGYRFEGVHTHQLEAAFQFLQSAGDLTLELEAFDIDVSDEVSVWLNGTLLDYLSVTANDSLGQSTVTIPSGLQQEGYNRLLFRQRTFGWSWGVTSLQLSESVVPGFESGVPVLSLDSVDTHSYGYRFGSVHTHQLEAAFQFLQSSDDLTLELEAFDIDVSNEVSVWLNGTLLDYLSVTENDSLGQSTVTIPSGLQQEGYNRLLFRQRTSGWSWGVTSLQLSESVVPGFESGVPVLSLDSVDTHSYGYRFGSVHTHQLEAAFQFLQSAGDLTLELEAFDIDVSDEVSVWLNGTLLDYLSVTANDSLGQSTVTIPSGLQQEGYNRLLFRQRTFGWSWGVTSLQLSESVVPGFESGVPVLSLDSVDTHSYGYRFGSVHTHQLEAAFQFLQSSDDLTLELEAFDIDVSNEVSVWLNGTLLDYLSVTENDSLGQSTVTIPSGLQQEGYNRLLFRQRTSGWSWGVKNLLVSKSPPRINQPPVAEIMPLTEAVVGEVVTLDGSGSTDPEGDQVGFEWSDHTNTVLSNLSTYQFTPTQTGIYRFVLTVYDPLGLTDRKTIDVTVKEKNIITNPILDDYELVFEDEFGSGLNELDSDKWDTALLWGPYLPINHEEQLYVDTLGMHAGFEYSPFSFTGETLKITAVPVSGSIPVPPRPPAGSPLWNPNDYSEYQFNPAIGEPGDEHYQRGWHDDDVKYLSGIITTYGSFRTTHGYFEVRAKFPAGKGLWPAFWLLPTHYVEDVPEIDVVEFLGQNTEAVYQTYHYFDVADNWRKVSTPTFEVSGEPWVESFNNYGVAWTPDSLVWYVNGIETHRISSSDYTISKQAMYMIANLAVGGNWPGSPDNNTVFPAVYEIDYIRAYRKKLSPGIDLVNDYQLVFKDEFDSLEIDASKWNTHYLWGPYLAINNEKQYYVDAQGSDRGEGPSPFSVDNGILSITARRVDDPEGFRIPERVPDDNDAIWNDYPGFNRNPDYQPGHYTSGVLTSYDAFKFAYGYAEIRAQIPEGDGLWPAFWLLNAYYVGQQPEIDVMEARGENPAEIIHSYHRSENGQLLSESFGTQHPQPGRHYADGFYRYGVSWQPGRIDWYIDGQLVHSYQAEDVPYQLMYVLLNLAVGGDFNYKAVDQETFPAEYKIDYVRVYQQKG